MLQIILTTAVALAISCFDPGDLRPPGLAGGTFTDRLFSEAMLEIAGRLTLRAVGGKSYRTLQTRWFIAP